MKNAPEHAAYAAKNASEHVAHAAKNVPELFCSETLVSDMRHESELLVPGFGHPFLLCRFKMPRARETAAYTYEMVTEHFATQI